MSTGGNPRTTTQRTRVQPFSLSESNYRKTLGRAGDAACAETDRNDSSSRRPATAGMLTQRGRSTTPRAASPPPSPSADFSNTLTRAKRHAAAERRAQERTVAAKAKGRAAAFAQLSTLGYAQQLAKLEAQRRAETEAAAKARDFRARAVPKNVRVPLLPVSCVCGSILCLLACLCSRLFGSVQSAVDSASSPAIDQCLIRTGQLLVYVSYREREAKRFHLSCRCGVPARHRRARARRGQSPSQHHSVCVAWSATSAISTKCCRVSAQRRKRQRRKQRATQQRLRHVAPCIIMPYKLHHMKPLETI